MADMLDTMTGSEAVAALRDGDMSSDELLEAQLARIEERNTAVNAVVAMDVDRARAEAEAADDARSDGESGGLLHGLSMTIKDTYETLGLTTTAGAPELATHVPERDADVVRAVRDEGAIVLGKTNVPAWAADHQTHNAVYGVTNNPWDVARTAGGSSGGAAAAVTSAAAFACRPTSTVSMA